MMAMATFALLLAGFTALALSMHKHHRDLLGQSPPRLHQFVLRIFGWSLLAASVVPGIIDCGVSVGLTFWFGITTIAVLAVAGTLSAIGAWKKRPMPTDRERDAHSLKSVAG